MNIEQYTNFLLTHLPDAHLVSGGKEINCRCLYCDDKHTHMYVKIPQNDNDPSMYNCFRCPAQGIVTTDTLNEWNCYDDEIAVSLINHNKNIKYVPKEGIRDVRHINWRYISNLSLIQPKVDYINNRLGINLSYQDMLNLKICFNLKDILVSNNIEEFTRSAYDIDLLNQYM